MFPAVRFSYLSVVSVESVVKDILIIQAVKIFSGYFGDNVLSLRFRRIFRSRCQVIESCKFAVIIRIFFREILLICVVIELLGIVIVRIILIVFIACVFFIMAAALK